MTSLLIIFDHLGSWMTMGLAQLELVMSQGTDLDLPMICNVLFIQVISGITVLKHRLYSCQTV
jgi:hypothetical protein